MDLLRLWWESPRNWWKNQWEGKPWNYGLMQYRTTPISSTLPSPLEMLTGRRPCSTLPQLPSRIGKNMETSRIREELLRRQPNNTSTGSPHGFGSWTTCLCQGSEWKHLENCHCWPTSSWAWFLLGEISGQFHIEKDQVNDQTQVSTFSFELQAEAQPGNFEGKPNLRSYDSFNQLNVNSMLPVTPMTSVTTSATTDRGKQSQWNNWSYHFHRGTPAYHEWSHTPCSFNTTKMFHQIHQRCSSR